MTSRTTLRLRVGKVGPTCSFTLLWGQGQELSAELTYPEALALKYGAWQQAYHNYYGALQRGGRVVQPPTINPFPPEYWHTRLGKSEAELLSDFYQWLRQAELYDIRSQIVTLARESIDRDGSGVDIFLTCASAELTRLPWETWEMGTGMVDPGTIRIARTPTTIRHEAVQPRRGRDRILAIVSYDGRQDFQADLNLIQKQLKGMAEIRCVTCQPDRPALDTKQDICAAIADERGWDILFFAGHSDEEALLGGELGIAPGVSLPISDIRQSLLQARSRGLQFALFNSCSGLNIAQSLIDLGLHQVAIMREPIPGNAAQEFLLRFLQSLAAYHDVHDALLSACQHLQLEKHLTYPSTYLVPSLFRYPDSTPLRLEPRGFRQRLRPWLPNLRETIALTAILLLSWMVPVQELLLETRTLSQTLYRQFTRQLPTDKTPPIFLIAIDQASINHAKQEIRDFKIEPLDREYLAQIVRHLSQINPGVIGIDYWLDTREPKQEQLLQAIQTSINNQSSWFVFAVRQDMALVDQALTNQSLQGGSAFFYWDVTLPADPTCQQVCPFAYLLALAYRLHQQPNRANLPQPGSENTVELQQQVSQLLQTGTPSASIKTLQKYATPPFNLRSILDFSIPPEYIYDWVPAWKFLKQDVSQPELQKKRQHQVALIAAGGYADAADNFPIPLAIAHWRKRPQLQIDHPDELPGGEVHAYMIHHILFQHQVLLIPDLWVIGLAILLGKGTALRLLKQKQRHHKQWAFALAGATAFYSLAGLQLYISAAVLLPWFLPTLMFWTYVLPILQRRKHV